MITDRQTYRKYVEEDLKAYGLTRVSLYNYLWMDTCTTPPATTR